MSNDDAYYDAVIVGAGPAGSSLAIRLARRGLRIALIEKSEFPRPKLCGEFISPECIDHFDDLGVLPSLRKAGAVDLQRTVFFSRRGRSIEVPSEWFCEGRRALGLTRAEMDLQLLEQALDGGTDGFLGSHVSSVGAIRDSRRTVQIRTKGKETISLRTPLLIDATGRQRAVAHLLGEKAIKAGHVAFKSHLENVGISDQNCELYSYDTGYGGCSKVENGLYNLCFITRADRAREGNSNADLIFRRLVSSNRRSAQVFAESRLVEPWLAVPISRYGRSRLVLADGVIAVGDAAAFIDPFTGSGILLALEGAKIAAACLWDHYFTKERAFDSFVRRYEGEYAAALNSRLRISALIRSMTRAPWMADAMISVLGSSRLLRRRLVRATRAAS